MSQTTPSTAGPLTVVLVHGAFADASSWTGVIERLQKEGGQVTAPASPLPRCLRRRPARRTDRRDGRHPAPRGRAGVLRADRGAGLEDLAFLGRRCERRQGGWQ